MGVRSSSLDVDRGQSGEHKLKSLTRKALENAAKVPPLRQGLRRLAHRGILPQRMWWWMRFDGPFAMAVEGGSTFTYVSSEDDRIGHAFYWAGVHGYEPETLRVFVPLARRACGFLDVGAAAGAFTLVASSVNDSLVTYAFEPLEESFARLTEHLRINGLAKRCVAANTALGDRVGQAKFFVPDPSVLSRDCSFLVDVRETPQWLGKQITVEMTTVAMSVPSDQPIDLVKIDAEGAEAIILEGMLPLLRAYHPTLIVEFFWNGSFREACALLDQLGYRYFHLTPAGPIRIDSVQPSPEDVYLNYLCVHESQSLPAEVLDLVWP